LGDEEVNKLQKTLAGAILVFMELLHLLIARNRDLLLHVIQERKRDASHTGSLGRAGSGALNAPNHLHHGSHPHLTKQRSHDGMSADGRGRTSNDDMSTGRGKYFDERSHNRHGSGFTDESHSTSFSTGGVFKTDSAIAVQSELQRAFMSLAKALYPMVSVFLPSHPTRWLKQCCNETYFSMGTYRQTRIPIGEELCFSAGTEVLRNQTVEKGDIYGAIPLAPTPYDYSGPDRPTHSPAGSIASSSVFSKASDNHR